MSLRRLREERGITQENLAALTNVSQAAISLYEAGKRDIPLPVALRVAAALNLEGVDALLAAAV